MKINWQKFLIWTLIGLFLGVGFLGVISEKANAQAPEEPPSVASNKQISLSENPGVPGYGYPTTTPTNTPGESDADGDTLGAGDDQLLQAIQGICAPSNIIVRWVSTFFNPLKGVVCAILYVIRWTTDGIITQLSKLVVPDTNQFKPPTGAPDTGKYYDWIIGPWKIMLGIADIFVVIVLLFLAIVNILHIQYDTYQIKKSLPLLIIGAVMANFSLLICRMINDVAEILVTTFTGSNLYDSIFNKLIKAIALRDTNISIIQSTVGGGMPLLIIFLIVSLITIIAFLVLIFLLYIRLAVMVFLFIVAPIAFIMLAFPPTQGIFKQWWSNFTKWVFMKPIMFMLLWLAGLIGTTGSDFALWLISIALTYFAFVVPFKLGGAVMGAWGNLGKKTAGWAGRGADYGILKATQRKDKEGKLKPGWSPSTLYQGYKLGKDAKKEQAYTLGAGGGRKFWADIAGERSDADILAEKTVGAKQWKEGPGAFDMESRAELGRVVDNAVHNGQMPLLKQVILGAAKDAMVGDIMEELSDEAKIKLKYVDENGNPIKKLGTDMDSQREFVKRVSGSDLRYLNEVENAWETAGIHGSMSVFRDPNTNTFSETTPDDKKEEDERVNKNRGRAYSADPMKFVRSFRPDELLDADKQLKSFGIKLLRGGLLSSEHLSLIGDSYGREALYAKLNTVENHAILDSEIVKGGEGVAFLQALKQSLITGSGHPPYSKDHIDKINIRGQDFNINSAALNEPAVQKELTTRMAHMNAQQANALAANVNANPSASAVPEFKNLISGLNNLRQTVEQAKGLESVANRGEADDRIRAIASTISQQIGNGMRAGIDPRKTIYETISAAPAGERDKLTKSIQKAMEESVEKVTTINQQWAPAAELIRTYKDAQSAVTTKPGKEPDKAKVQIQWSGMMDGKNATPQEKIRAWEFIRAYTGEKPSDEKPQARRRRRDRRGEEFYGDIESE